MSFNQNLKKGLAGENDIATFFKMQGFNILPVYEVETSTKKGPVLYTHYNSRLVAPDLLIFRLPLQDNEDAYSDTMWIEAKTKSACTFYRIGKCFETGIDLYHFNQYLEIQKTCPFPIYLTFLQKNGTAKDTPKGMKGPTGLFAGKLTKLAQEYSHKTEKYGKGGMIYWEPFKHLICMATLEEINSNIEFNNLRKFLMRNDIKNDPRPVKRAKAIEARDNGTLKFNKKINISTITAFDT